MNLTWQNLQRGPGDETPCFAGTLCADGKPVASVRSDGSGGCANVWWLDGAPNRESPLRKAVAAASCDLALAALRAYGDPITAATRRFMASIEESVLVWGAS